MIFMKQKEINKGEIPDESKKRKKSFSIKKIKKAYINGLLLVVFTAVLFFLLLFKKWKLRE